MIFQFMTEQKSQIKFLIYYVLFIAFLSAQTMDHIDSKALINTSMTGIYNSTSFGDIKHHDINIYGSGLKSNFVFQYNNFKIVNSMFLSNEWKNAAKGGGKKVKSVFGYTHEGYVQYSRSWDKIQNQWKVGRSFVIQGLGKMSQLLISRESRPFDLISWDINYKDISGNMTGIQLENIDGKKRFLSLHTMNWNINNKLTLSFSESSIYSGENRGIEWQFINPVIFWVPERENPTTGQANGFIYAGFSYFHTPTLSFWGELLIDDYQINRESKGDLEPNEVGFLGGVEKTQWPVKSSDLWLEYTRITNRTYQTTDISETYTHRGFPIGHYLGNDFDLFQFYYTQLSRNEKLKPYISIAYLRDGANGLDTPFDTPWEDSTVTMESGYTEPFPTRPVTYTSEIELAVDYYLKEESTINGGVVYHQSTRQGKKENDFVIVLRLWLSLNKKFNY